MFAGPALEPAGWYAACDAYLSCSEHEGLPLGPIEALGSALPAVLSDIPGHAFLRGRARQYPLNAPERGAECLAQLVRELRGEARAAGEAERLQHAAWARERFSLERMCREYFERYLRLTSGA